MSLSHHTKCFMSGWGRTVSGSGGNASSNPSIYLKWTSVSYMSGRNCSEYCVPPRPSCQTIDSSKICFDSSSNSSSACQGDSGGPLVCLRNDGKPIILGITSLVTDYGDYCNTNYPNIYARVTTFLDWIKSKMENCKDIYDCSELSPWCNNDAYPWITENCKKTCSVC